MGIYKTFWELSRVLGLNLKSLPSKYISKYLSWSVLFNLNNWPPSSPSIIALIFSELETWSVDDGVVVYNVVVDDCVVDEGVVVDDGVV